MEYEERNPETNKVVKVGKGKWDNFVVLRHKFLLRKLLKALILKKDGNVGMGIEVLSQFQLGVI